MIHLNKIKLKGLGICQMKFIQGQKKNRESTSLLIFIENNFFNNFKI